METLAYRAKFERGDDGGITITFPEIPFAISGTFNEDEAEAMARDCLEEAIASLVARNEVLPKPKPARKGERMIAVPAVTAAKALLNAAVRERNVTQRQLASRLKVDQKEVRRMLDPHSRATKIGRLEEALASFGITVAMCVPGEALGWGPENRRAR
jgi:antitoxin HicB